MGRIRRSQQESETGPEKEWDADGDDLPDTYFLVQNPLKLRESLKRSLDTIVERSASAGNITSNGQQIEGGSKVFQTLFNSASWDGELFAYPVTASGVSTTPSWRASEQLPVIRPGRMIHVEGRDDEGDRVRLGRCYRMGSGRSWETRPFWTSCAAINPKRF